MKCIPLVLALTLTACTSVPKDAAHAEGDLIIAEMAAQTSFNAAKPHLTAAQVTSGQKALDEWLAALVAADNARKAGDAAATATALANAAKAQAAAPKGN